MYSDTQCCPQLLPRSPTPSHDREVAYSAAWDSCTHLSKVDIDRGQTGSSNRAIKSILSVMCRQYKLVPPLQEWMEGCGRKMSRNKFKILFT